MNIHGSIAELRAIFLRALAIGAPGINFVFPNHAVAVAPTGEYAYFRTTLFVAKSAFIPRAAILNLQRFLRVVHKQRNQIPSSPFYGILMQTVTIKETYIEFDRDPRRGVEMNTEFHLLDQASELNDKIETLGRTSLHLDRPYLKLDRRVIEQLHRTLKAPVEKMLVGPGRYLNRNRLFIQAGELHIERDPRTDQARFLQTSEMPVFTEQDDFTVMQDFAHVSFPLYDLDIFSMHRMIKVIGVDTVVLIPYGRFYLAEGHNGDLACKFHMKLPE